MREALAYPFRGEHAEKALLSTWLCVFVHAVLLPFVALVPVAGYVATVLARGRGDEPPVFLDRAVLARGLGATGLAIGYGLVPFGTAAVAFRFLFGADRPPTATDAIFVLAASTAVLIVLGGYAYVLPIALANYGRAGSLRAGVSDLGGVANHAAYFLGWASGVGIGLVGAAASTALVDLGGVYAVAGSFVGAYAIIAASRRIARGYAAAR